MASFVGQVVSGGWHGIMLVQVGGIWIQLSCWRLERHFIVWNVVVENFGSCTIWITGTVDLASLVAVVASLVHFPWASLVTLAAAGALAPASHCSCSILPMDSQPRAAPR